MSYDDWKMKAVAATWIQDPLDGIDPVWCQYCQELVEEGDLYDYEYGSDGYAVWHKKCRPQ